MVAATLVAAASSVAPAYAQAPLAVPYLPQTEALCGGAAAAMVMRFWGARGVYADAFAPLVDKQAGGIHTSALQSTLSTKGWNAQGGGGDLGRLAHEIALGRPVIALIEDRPGRFHYVVVVATTPYAVVVHDPARAPSRTIDVSTFDRKWQRSDRWMLILLPGAASPASIPASAEPDVTSEKSAASVCLPAISEAVTLADRGDTAGARKLLDQATGKCPEDASVWRELAGLDAIEKHWDAAAGHARAAVARDASDAFAWRLLATSEYLRHDDLAALAAWNRLDEPRVDLVAINGLDGTRYRTVADAVGVEPRQLLSPSAVRLAQRRVRAIPSIAAARIGYQPLEGGIAQVDATVVERPRLPATWPAWAGVGVGAAANREAAVTVANISGGGDAMDVSWRWWPNRPRVAVSYAAPGPLGVWRLDVSRETQTFGERRAEETRSRIGGEISNWIDQRIRVAGGLAIDRWAGVGRTGSLSGRAELWPWLDRMSIEFQAAGWRGSGESFAVGGVRSRFRSKAGSSGTILLADGGMTMATSTAPASLWPGADTGHARDVLLRAHPLLEDGVIEGGVFGRRIGFASLEARRWLAPAAQGFVRLAPALFLDVARASRGLTSTDTRTHYDAGAGLRISLLGAGVLRVDVAHGLRDGRTALSLGWQK
jgi:hypothetical protein